MIAPFVWVAAVLALIFVCAAAYVMAPGLGVLLFIVGIVALVVAGDRAERREWEDARRDRLRESAHRTTRGT